MRPILIVLTLYGLAIAQTNQDGKTNGTPIADQLGNHHVLLVPATAPGTGLTMWIAIGPSGNLAILPVADLSQKMGEGYRPYTFGELRENISALISANASLEAELKTMRTAPQAVNASPAQREEEARINAEHAAADRQQQLKLERARMLYNLLMMQGARPAYQVPMPVQPKPGINCTSRTIGTTVYTDCH